MEPTYLTIFATTVLESFQTVWEGLLVLLPNIIAAAIVLVIGWIIAAGFGKLISRLVELTKVDDLIDKSGFDKSLVDAGIDFSLAKFIGWLSKWFLLIVVLIAVAEILRLQEITQFLQTIALYIPNIIIAVVILLVGVVLGNFSQKVVQKSVEASQIATAAGVLATAAKWAIYAFALLAALNQLQIAKELINTLFTGLVGMLALAGGLAFGLGGKDAARDFLEKIRREVKS